MPSPTNTPDSPPVGPIIPEGLATKMGKWGTALLALVALLAPLLEDFGTNDSKHFATLAALIGGVTIIGRMLQSAAALRAGTAGVAAPGQSVGVIDGGGEDEEYLYDINGDQIDDELNEGAPVDDAVPQASSRHNGPGTDLHDAQGA